MTPARFSGNADGPQKGSPRSIYPIIADDSFDVVSPSGSNLGEDQDLGLSGRGNVNKALLSMSGYGKPQFSAVRDYDANRPFLGSYLDYNSTNFVQPQESFSRQSPQVPYSASVPYQPPAADVPQATFPASEARPIPTFTSFSPQRGTLGTQVFVNLLSAFDLEETAAFTLTIMLATQACPSTLTKVNQQGSYWQYALSTDVPSFASTAWTNSQVPLRVQVHDHSGLDLGLVNVGTFSYTDGLPAAAQASSPELSRKRKASDASDYPTKRAASQRLHSANSEAYDRSSSYSYLPSNSSYMQTPVSRPDSMSSIDSQYSKPIAQPVYRAQSSPRNSQHMSASSVTSLHSRTGLSPQSHTWSPTLGSSTPQRHSPSLAIPATSRVGAISSPTSTPHPPLIRTSTLQQTPSPSSTPSGGGSGSFNPYSIYPHKAVLKINGDLDGMVEDWTKDERECNRRLVQFWRSQSGSTINTNFKPVSPENRQPNSTCISCIWWEAKQECYVTSVDTIFLLESLVAVRFTVEEKNRIRRNLEGFRPVTVSKGKSDSEEFFKLIMGFPNPKPRNIEKDVKVFPWKILAHALKKIIGKYSASYSSTASAIPPSMSAYPPTSHSDLLDTSHLLTASPRPLASSSMPYAPLSTTSTAHSYPLSYANPPTGASTSQLHQAYAPASYPSYPQHQTPHQQSNAYSAHHGGGLPAPTLQSQPASGSRSAQWDYAASFDAGTHGATAVDASDVYYSRLETPAPGQYQQVSRTSAGS